jgi:mRNA interferase MazF
MQEGDIILARVPQADGQLKNRPAVLLREMPPYRDLLVCGVSTQLHQYVQDFDELIISSDSEFAASGLQASSVIRLGFLAVLPRKSIIGTIGALSSRRHARLLQRLSQHLVGGVSSTAL